MRRWGGQVVSGWIDGLGGLVWMVWAVAAVAPAG